MKIVIAIFFYKSEHFKQSYCLSTEDWLSSLIPTSSRTHCFFLLSPHQEWTLPFHSEVAMRDDWGRLGEKVQNHECEHLQLWSEVFRRSHWERKAKVWPQLICVPAFSLKFQNGIREPWVPDPFPLLAMGHLLPVKGGLDSSFQIPFWSRRLLKKKKNPNLITLPLTKTSKGFPQLLLESRSNSPMWPSTRWSRSTSWLLL